MNRKLPNEYVVQKFYQLSGFPKYIKGTNTYRASCNICREGKSWGKKKRLNYIPDKNLIHCFNCNQSWSPEKWIMESTGMEFMDIVEESKDFDFSDNNFAEEKIQRPESDTLPKDSINLFDKQQVEYYSTTPVIKDAMYFIKKRRLDTAINKPKALYISLTDFIHKNRLVIPFYNYQNKISWYQTRAIYKKDEKDRPKYMSKLNSERSVYGLSNIDEQLDYIFIFEGPIDSMFVKNGVAMCGISMSDTQTEEMKRYRLYKKIWVLDNQLHENRDVKNQVRKLAEYGERVFFWPDKYKGIKDVNELCVKVGKNSIKPDFFIKNSYEGLDALKLV